MLPPKFDPFALLQHGDPYLTYARLREAGPLLRATPGIWMLPRHEEVSAALRDPRVGSFRFDQNGHLLGGTQEQGTASHAAARSFLDGAVVATSGPGHLRIRTVLRETLTKRLTSDLQESIDQASERILASALERGGLEVVSELAHVLPVDVIANLLGVDACEPAWLAHTVLKLSALFSPFISEAEKTAADGAVIQLRQLISSIFEERLSHPLDDLISDLALASTKGLLTLPEAVDNTIFLLFAGLETSVTMLAAGCAALAGHPNEFIKLKENPRVIATAVEEFLRFDAPTQITARRVLHPLEIAGHSLSPGRVVLLLLGSANHDERQFEQPSRLDVGRTPNPHVAFGAGAHYCIGAALARMEGAAVFRKIAEKFHKFEARSEPLREASVTPRIYLRVDISVVGT